MARAKLTATSNDLVTDSGSVLWSLVKGEQLEYPILLDFMTDATVQGYIFEAVVIEAFNLEGQLDRPSVVRPFGAKTTLGVRRPNFVGVWSPIQQYNFENVVLYMGLYYKLLTGAARVNAEPPVTDSAWEETALNIVNLQFPLSLGDDWSVKPTVNSPAYGFFELRVKEPNNSIFVRTWKPIRGMVELHYSPTDEVVDV
jgi:hypothetical protein